MYYDVNNVELLLMINLKIYSLKLINIDYVWYIY